MFTASLPWEFQSTLPVRGATVRCWIWTRTGKISIHAPREGSDHAGDRKSIQLHRFQSTLPVRGATSIGVYVDHLSLFQSTLPVRGATADGIVITDSAAEFQSTLPVRGATADGIVITDSAAEFQSTLPVRGATISAPTAGRQPQISIHAPREGSDLRLLLAVVPVEISIHAPREGSDPRDLSGHRFQSPISIHAPREGSDRGCPGNCPRPPNFNPRSP